MMNRWLGSIGLLASLWIGAAAADDGWRPASASSKTTGGDPTTVSAGALGVTLGRPMPADDSSGADASGFAVSDSNLRRTSYETPATPPLFRLQSAEVPQPLPRGPATKTGSIPASPVSTSISGFAAGRPTAAEPATSAFASDPTKPDATVEAIPAPQSTLVPEPAGGEVLTHTASSPCDCNGRGTICCSQTFCDQTCSDPSRLYITGEYLLWWIKNSHMPPLVTTAPVGSTGVLGEPGTTVLFGGHLDNEERSGGRFTAGYWFDNCHTLALESTFFFLANRSVNFAANSGTSPVLARPFFNLNSGTEFSEVTTSPGLATGGIAVNTFSHLWGAEINLRYNVCDNCCWRFDVLGGFRYLRLKEGLDIQESILAAPTAPMFAGDMIVVNDDFTTRNQFYGGQIGYRLGWTHNRWSIDWLTKIAFGDTRQTVDINGNQLITTPGGTTTLFNGGLLALPSNTGSFSRDRFAVVPETDLVLGFRVTPHIKLLIGYSFLYWSNVVRPGNQIDRVIDVSQIPNSGLTVPPTGQGRPAVLFKSTDFWAQGISFGMEFVF
jgi:hypothetical protein